MIEGMHMPGEGDEKLIVTCDGIYARVKTWEPKDAAKFDQMKAEIRETSLQIDHLRRGTLRRSWILLFIAVWNIFMLTRTPEGDWMLTVLIGASIGIAMLLFGYTRGTSQHLAADLFGDERGRVGPLK